MTVEPSSTLHGPAGARAPSQAAGDAYTERWEDEGGARPERAITPREPPAPSRSHHYGEGQTHRTSRHGDPRHPRQELGDGCGAGCVDGGDEPKHDRKAGAPSGLDALLLSLDVYLTELTTSGELRTYFMLLSSAVAELNELRAVFAAQHERVRERLSDLVAKGQADGSIRPEIDADAVALMIGSLQLGLSMQILVDPTMDLGPIRRVALNTLRLSFAADPKARLTELTR